MSYYAEIILETKSQIISDIPYEVDTLYFGYHNDISVPVVAVNNSERELVAAISGTFIPNDYIEIFKETNLIEKNNFSQLKAFFRTYTALSFGDAVEKSTDYSNYDQELYNLEEPTFGNLLPTEHQALDLSLVSFTNPILTKLCIDNFKNEVNSGPSFYLTKENNYFYQSFNSAYTVQVPFYEKWLHINYSGERDIKEIRKSLKLVQYNDSLENLNPFEYYETLETAFLKEKTLTESTTWKVKTDYGNYPIRRAGGNVSIEDTVVVPAYTKEFIEFSSTYQGVSGNLYFAPNMLNLLEKKLDFPSSGFNLSGEYEFRGQFGGVPLNLPNFLDEEVFKHRVIKLEFSKEFPFAEGIILSQGEKQNTIFNLLYVKSGASYLREFKYPTAQSHTDTTFSATLEGFSFDTTPIVTDFEITKSSNSFNALTSGKAWFSSTGDIELQVFHQDTEVTLSSDMVLERFESVSTFTDAEIETHFGIVPQSGVGQVYIFSTSALKTEGGSFKLNIIPKRFGVKDSLKADFFTELSYVSGFVLFEGSSSRSIHLTTHEPNGIESIEITSEGLLLTLGEVSWMQQLRTAEFPQNPIASRNYYSDRQQIVRSQNRWLIKGIDASNAVNNILKFKLGFEVQV